MSWQNQHVRITQDCDSWSRPHQSFSEESKTKRWFTIWWTRRSHLVLSVVEYQNWSNEENTWRVPGLDWCMVRYTEAEIFCTHIQWGQADLIGEGMISSYTHPSLQDYGQWLKWQIMAAMCCEMKPIICAFVWIWASVRTWGRNKKMGLNEKRWVTDHRW